MEIEIVESRDHVVPQKDEEVGKFTVYARRWGVLFSFCIADIFNAMIWTTFTSISDITQHYFGPSHSFYTTTTGVNMLANIQLVVFPFGTAAAFFSMRYIGARNTVLMAAFVTVISSVIKYIAAIYRDDLGPQKTYAMMSIGQALAGFIQPVFTNFPATLSSLWFPFHERDVSTSFGAMSSSVGSAIGSIVPPFIVSETENADGSFEVHDMSTLMLFQLIVTFIAFCLLLVFFWDAPPTPPSRSEKMINQLNVASTDDDQHQIARDTSEDALYHWAALCKDLQQLFTDTNYLVLLFCFSIGVGIFNALLTVINQFVEPLGYSNEEAGLLGGVFVLCGIIGAVIMALLMQHTKDYRMLAKYGIVLSNGMLVIVLGCLYRDNFGPLMFAFALFGLTTVPLIPLVVENCAEISYPVPGHISYGIIQMCMIVISLALSFAFEFLCQVKRLGPPPLYPINIVLYGIFSILTLVVIFGYHGEYKRITLDRPDHRPPPPPLDPEDQRPSTGKHHQRVGNLACSLADHLGGQSEEGGVDVAIDVDVVADVADDDQ